MRHLSRRLLQREQLVGAKVALVVARPPPVEHRLQRLVHRARLPSLLSEHTRRLRHSYGRRLWLTLPSRCWHNPAVKSGGSKPPSKCIRRDSCAIAEHTHPAPGSRIQLPQPGRIVRFYLPKRNGGARRKYMEEESLVSRGARDGRSRDPRGDHDRQCGEGASIHDRRVGCVVHGALDRPDVRRSRRPQPRSARRSATGRRTRPSHRQVARPQGQARRDRHEARPGPGLEACDAAELELGRPRRGRPRQLDRGSSLGTDLQGDEDAVHLRLGDPDDADRRVDPDLLPGRSERSVQGPTTARFIRTELNAKKVVIIDDQTAYSVPLANSVQANLTASEITVDRQSVNQNQTDFSALVATVGDDVDVVYLPWQIAANGQLFAQQMKKQGKKATIVGSDGLFSRDFTSNGAYVFTFAPDIRILRTSRRTSRASRRRIRTRTGARSARRRISRLRFC